MPPFISLCMIVKDEEKVLDRCLTSVMGIIDEIVIVDTGSTDNTKNIAIKHTDFVYDFEWTNNFSEARNYAASKATGEWILVLDADEFVDPENLKQSISEIKQHDNQYGIYAVNIINFAGEKGESIAQHKHGRIYRNDGNIEFYRSVHEQLRAKHGSVNFAVSSLVIYHSGYLSNIVREKEKITRNSTLIQNELGNSTSVAFDYFNLGNEFKREGKMEEALDSFIKAYKEKNSNQLSWVSFCLCNIVECLISLKRYDNALEVIKDAEVVYSNSADFTFFKGEIYLLQHRYKEAKRIYSSLIRNSKKYYDIIKSPDFLEYYPYRRLGYIFELEGNLKESVKSYANAINIKSDCLESTFRLVKLLAKHHNDKEIFEFLSRSILHGKMSDRYFIQLIKLFLNQSLFKLCQMIGAKYLADDELIINLLQFKGQIISGEYRKEMFETIDTTFILSGLNLGLLDLNDLFIFFNDLGTAPSTIKNSVKVILNTNSVYEMLINGLIYNQSLKTEEIDTSIYLSLLEKCLIFNKVQLLENLIVHQETWNLHLDAKIASIFYRNGYEDLSINFYQKAQEEDLTEEDFNLIIKYLIKNDNELEAKRIAKIAFNIFDKDPQFERYLKQI
ncbi:hypothetical protein ABE29_18765 [Cytobacillus firmus]|uniref:tetratricopeptide repeat-containing glycosyltransferase family 2 protein n=1 Tax=Cytobacillus firmus TaxID=1399 RepID=UPI00077CBA00|nr:glycosyltransferase [Cytobacillus firmus]MBG9544725.1 hypothetical protein [Cytobacillus firmus]MBG9553996.1 hypothetical protein [Cytobacillus firmus]MBG9558472.1 hypothetical protein [Cytobacillus firmus]MBG9576985.1 hypothetical protein [Cytobacillus firmus]MEC1894364.1 glycosyltransferase [Cytobacillus firmus]